MQVLKTALALQLASAPTMVLDVKNAKPIHALVRLREQVQDNAAARAEWRKKARTAAVIGSCPRSLQSLDSGDYTYSLHGHLWRCRICLPGISHWRKYIAIAHGDENVDSMSFPPRLEDVLGWSNTFRLPLGDLRALALLLHDCAASRCVVRCIGTFGNYMSYLRAACLANGYDAPPVGHPAIRRAMVAVAKRELFTARPKMFVQR